MKETSDKLIIKTLMSFDIPAKQNNTPDPIEAARLGHDKFPDERKIEVLHGWTSKPLLLPRCKKGVYQKKERLTKDVRYQE